MLKVKVPHEEKCICMSHLAKFVLKNAKHTQKRGISTVRSVPPDNARIKHYPVSHFNFSSNGLHCVHTAGGTTAPETTTEMSTIPGEKGTYLIILPFFVHSLSVISLIMLDFANAKSSVVCGPA